MKPGRKKLLWLGLALALLAAGTVIWRSATSLGPPQVITLSDGHQYQFAGVTWGTNHVAPGIWPHLLRILPTRVADNLNAKFGKVAPRQNSTPEPSLLVWFKPVGPRANASPFGPRTIVLTGDLEDEKGVVGGVNSRAPLVSFFAPIPVPWTYFQFPVVPRRSGQLQCKIDELVLGGAPVTNSLGVIRFLNPLFGQYPQWQPEPLPVAKSAGDLKVELKKLELRSVSPRLGLPARISFAIEIHSPDGKQQNWMVADMELGDATGNLLSQHSPGSLSPDGMYSLAGILWPDEQAYKLRLGLKRTKGYDASETVTFTNLPLSPPPTNTLNLVFRGVSMTNVIQGSRIVLRNYLDPKRGLSWSGPNPGPYWVEYEVLDDAQNLVVEFGGVSMGGGAVAEDTNSRLYGENHLNFRSFPTNTKALTVTLVVQKKRYVEFLVKPPNAK